MSDLKKLIKKARDERETGDLNRSLDMFLDINKKEIEQRSQLMDYLGEMGLTYFHLKEYEKSKECYEEAKSVAEEDGNISYKALMLRHLSRPEFNEDNIENSVNLAKDARALAKEAGRKDLAWFDHGVVSALLKINTSQEEVKNWYEIEAMDLYEISQHDPDSIAVWIWVTGLLIDRSKIFNDKSDLYLALTISEKFNLERRKEEISKLLE